MALAISFALLLLSRMALPQNPCMVSTRACVNLPAPPRAFPSANFFVVMKASIKYSILLQNRWRMAGVGEGGAEGEESRLHHSTTCMYIFS